MRLVRNLMFQELGLVDMVSVASTNNLQIIEHQITMLILGGCNRLQIQELQSTSGSLVLTIIEVIRLIKARIIIKC